MDWSNIINQIISVFSPSGNSPTPSPVEPKFEGTDLKLIRKTSDELSTEGEMYINNVFFCYTIELPKVSAYGSNVCIPEGTYFLQKYLSPHWGFEVPLLQNVPGRSEIEIHPSNYAISPDAKHHCYLLGCIALGNSEDTDVVYNSKDTFNKFMSQIDWTRKVRITITEE
jgi:hypothetical protein